MSRMKPAQINEISDDVLHERVGLFAANPHAQCRTALVPYATYGLVRRIQEEVTRLNKSGQCVWPKQVTVALALASVTGIASKSRDELEYIGNAVDARLRDYSKHLSKAKGASKKRAQRAQKSGRQLSHDDSRINALEERLYVCEYGGTPLKIPIIEDSERLPCRQLPINAQRVPYRVLGVDELLSDYKKKHEELVQSRHEPAKLQSLERDTRSTIAFAELARERFEASEERANAAAALLHVAASEAQDQIEKVKEDRKLCENKRKAEEGRVVCLEGKLTHALKELEREGAKRARLAIEAEERVKAIQEQLCVAQEKARECAARVKEASLQCQKNEGKILVMEGKLVRACQEAFHEQQKRQRVEAAADAQLDILRDEIESEKQNRELCRRLQQQIEHERTCKDAEVLRLQGKLGRALQDTAHAKEETEKVRTNFKRRQQAMLDRLQGLEGDLSRQRDLKNNMARKVREANRKEQCVDEVVSELHRCRQRVRELNKEVSTLKTQLCCSKSDDDDDSLNDLVSDTDRAQLEDNNSDPEWSDDSHRTAAQRAEADEAVQRLKSMPQWRAVRGKGAGKGAAKLEWRTRLVIYSLLALMVPVSAVGMAIVMVVKITAPWLRPTAPTYETVQRCRFELRLLEEAIAARRIASCTRLRAIGFDETTKLGSQSLTTSVTIEPSEGGELEDVILRAAYCPFGGTAELVVKSIEERCVRRIRDFLRRWEQQFHKMFPHEKWTGPDPSQCSLHRLGGRGCIMSDTCNAARSAKRKLAGLIGEQVKQNLGEQLWQQMSAEEREAAARVHLLDCWGHIRNIFLEHMSSELAAHVKDELRPELDTFAAWERMSTEYSQLLRACYKEFHHGCRYYKGKGREFSAWLIEKHPRAFVLHLERADGGRQDLDFDAAIPLYIDRPYFIQYLHGIVFGPDHSNILEDFLYVTMRSTQYIAMTRANALIDIFVSRPLRWLSGKSRQLTDWSPYSMGEALDLVHDFFERAQHDGSLFLDPSLNIFAPIAAKQPLFAEWQRHTFTEDSILSPDGSTKHKRYKLVRDELTQPVDPTNVRTRMKTIEYLEVQCKAGLRKMLDPKLAIRDKLSSCDGENAVGNQTQGHADTLGCNATNDALAESVFGTYDMILRRCPGISMEAASGVAQAIQSKVLSLADCTLRRKKSTQKERKDYMGYVYSLPAKEQEALVELARLTIKEMRDIDRAEHGALDEYHKERRRINERDELDALFTRYALALSFFQRWQKRGVETASAIAAELRQFGGDGVREQDKLNWLREQIEMRTIGMSWTQFQGKWSSSKDEEIGSVQQLTDHLKVILVEEAAQRRDNVLPCKTSRPEDVCPAPQLKRKTFKALGTPTVQAQALSDSRIDLTAEEILEKAISRRKELEAAGDIDWVCDRQKYPVGKGPPLDSSLVGKRLEVRWRYVHQDTGKPVYMWCEGEVVQVADGQTDKKSSRAKKILPAGAVRIKWPQDVEFDEEESFVWSILNPNNFNKDVHLGWRFAASELQDGQ